MPHHHERKKKAEAKQKLVDRRNFNLGVWNGVLYNLGKSFISPTTILPGFLSHLTSSSALIGFITTFESIGWYLPQLPVSVWVQHKQRKMPVYRGAAVVRTIAFVLLAIVTLLSPSSEVLLVTSVITLLAFYLASGPGGLVFMDLYAKAIPPDRRGKFIGLRMAIGGILSATFGAFIISSFLSGYSFPYNFGAVFVVGAVITSLSFFFMSVMREPREKVVTAQRTYLEQWKVCVAILRNDIRFRRYITARLSFELFTLGLPFIFLFANRKLGYTTNDIGIFIAVECVGIVISNYIWAVIADKNSNKAVLVGTVFVAMLMPLMIIAYSFFDLPRILFPAIFMITAAVDSGRSIGGMGYLVDIIPVQERMTYSALYNSLLAVPVVLAALAGVLLDSFGYVFLYTLLLGAMILTYYYLRGLEDIHASERIA